MPQENVSHQQATKELAFKIGPPYPREFAHETFSRWKKADILRGMPSEADKAVAGVGLLHDILKRAQNNEKVKNPHTYLALPNWFRKLDIKTLKTLYDIKLMLLAMPKKPPPPIKKAFSPASTTPKTKPSKKIPPLTKSRSSVIIEKLSASLEKRASQSSNLSGRPPSEKSTPSTADSQQDRQSSSSNEDDIGQLQEDIMKCMEEGGMTINPDDVKTALKEAQISRLPVEMFFCMMAKSPGPEFLFYSALAYLRWDVLRKEVADYKLLQRTTKCIEYDSFDKKGPITYLLERPPKKVKPKSPYAWPVPYVTAEYPPIPAKNYRTKEKRGPLSLAPPVFRRRFLKKAREGTVVVDIYEDTIDIRRSLKKLAVEGNPMAAMPDMHKLMVAIERIRDDYLQDFKKLMVNMTPIYRGQARSSIHLSQYHWMSKRLVAYQASLPLPATGSEWTTYKYLLSIRQKRDAVLNNYFTFLRRVKIMTAWQHWKGMKIDSFCTQFSRLNYVNTFEAYESSREKSCPILSCFLGLPSLPHLPKHPEGWQIFF